MKNLFLFFLLVGSSFVVIAQSTAPSHEAFTRLLKKHVSSKGNVNYGGFIKDSSALSTYLNMLRKNPPAKSWSREDQMAYWINAYNAFTIVLITKYYPIKSIKDIGSSIQIPFVNTPWDIKFIQIGKDKLDLNNIEHGILRKRFFDPRLHMVLVCASKSCPILLNEAYEGRTLDSQLTKQSRVFLSDPQRNKVSVDHAELSMIFKWYNMDFNNDGKNVRDFVNQYGPVQIKRDAKISFIEYDWTLNE